MKKVFFAIALMLGVTGATNAQETTGDWTSYLYPHKKLSNKINLAV